MLFSSNIYLHRLPTLEWLPIYQTQQVVSMLTNTVCYISLPQWITLNSQLVTLLMVNMTIWQWHWVADEKDITTVWVRRHQISSVLGRIGPEQLRAHVLSGPTHHAYRRIFIKNQSVPGYLKATSISHYYVSWQICACRTLNGGKLPQRDRWSSLTSSNAFSPSILNLKPCS